jgi:phytanoyl-CoA hydroxylase
MRLHLTEHEISTYREQGFLVVPNLLDAAEIAVWREVVTQAVEVRVAASNAPSDEYDAKVFTQCLRLADDFPAVRALVYDPRLAAIAAHLAGVSGLRCWHDQALFKSPWAPQTSWHLDDPFWSFDHPQAITVWVALDEATPANGCLYYLPGTHRQARYDHTPIGSQIGGLFQQYPEWSQITPVAAPVPAGGAVFHNGLTAHAAGCNLSGKPRRAMTMAWMPDGAVFNGKRNIMPERLFNSLRVGDVLQDPEFNPLLWKA